jgi:hypothetical protein
MVLSASAHRRRGLSYLEVLIAAGIGLTGILGAVALFPLAAANMRKGVVADCAAYIGPSAEQQASVTGALNPNRWLMNDRAFGGTTGLWGFNGTTAITASSAMGYPTNAAGLNTATGLWGAGVGYWASYCIDPRFCAEMSPIAAPAGDVPYTFPYTASQNASDVRMVRVTLPNSPSSTLAASAGQARLLFKVSDDLIFDRPKDALGQLPASQGYLIDNTNTNQRRDYMAEFEYLLTLTPRMVGIPVFQDVNTGALLNSQSNPEPVPFERPTQYSLSVVVMHQRQPLLNTIVPGTANDTEAERVLDVVSPGGFLGNGIGGGDVLVQSRAGRPATDTVVHEGDWVMLSGMLYVTDSNGPKIAGPIFRWYRVTSLQGEAFPQGGVYQRYLTLDGPDWPVSNVPNGTQMTIVSGVVGVYEAKAPVLVP